MTLLVCLIDQEELDETIVLQKHTEVFVMVKCLINVQPSVATFKFSFTTKEKTTQLNTDTKHVYYLT